MNALFEKWLCKHKWKSHCAKEVTTQVFEKNGFEYKPSGVTRTFHREVLICENCGKIKTIEY